ncbi:Cilia- and flagella-associated protein 74 [Vulpes lagopus]
MEEDASLFPKKELLDSVPLLEDEREDLEDPEYEAEFLPPEAENSTDLGYCCTDADKSKKRPAVPDRLKACHLRKTWSHLEKLREEKELFIQKSRGELRACRQRIDLITKQQASVAAEVAAGREANNTSAAVGRLQAVSRRLCMELDNERDLQSKITALLQKSELNTMWHLAIQEGQLEDVRKSAQEEEVTSRKYLREQAAKQLRKEEEASEKIKRNRLLRVRHQKLVEDAQKNHRIAVKFLKASLRRIREQEKEEEMKSREHMKRRMDAVLALKNSITANRETLRKFQAWSQAKADLAEQKAQAEKEMILAQGGDAFKQLFHQRRCEELEAQNRTFEEEQKLRKQEIINRILKEEAEEEKRKKKQSSPAPAMGQAPLREKTWSYITDICEGRDAVALPSFPGDKLQDGDRAEHPKASQFLEAISSESIQGDLRNVSWEDDTLAEPEIPGLWKEDYKPYQDSLLADARLPWPGCPGVPKEEADRKPVDGTKMDKDILARTMEKLRSRVTHKQVVSGHEFKGRPFNSKPKLIHFKDFDIGKVYKKKITLINATYTINYCKLVGVEEHLRDFIHIDFDPPGPMSAGMSCEVLVTFKPMINKDLEGNVSFLAQTGGFSVPLKCSTKKCTLSLDKELIDFGSYVVGETTSRIITLTNIGGLGTRFKFVRASESYEMDLSQSVMKISSLFTYEDKGSYEKIIISPSEQQMEGNESSPFDMQSQKESGKLDNKEQEEGHPTATAPGTVPAAL